MCHDLVFCCRRRVKIVTEIPKQNPLKKREAKDVMYLSKTALLPGTTVVASEANHIASASTPRAQANKAIGT